MQNNHTPSVVLRFAGRLFAIALAGLPLKTQAQLIYITNNGAITITGAIGWVGNVSIPSVIDGLPVTSIGNSAFFARDTVAAVQIADSVTNIGWRAFSSSSAAGTITIGPRVEYIGYGAFAACPRLLSINVDSSNRCYSSFEGVLFDKNRTTLIQCPGGKIGSYQVPGDVVSIADEAFCGCSQLTSVGIPNSVTEIGFRAFTLCDILPTVRIPASVTNLGATPFCGAGLTNIDVDTRNPCYSSVGGVLFNRDRTKLIEFPRGARIEAYDILNGVVTIGQSAFSSCRTLTNVVVPESVRIIEDAAFNDTGLTSIVIPQNVSSLGQGAFYECQHLGRVYFQGDAPAIGLAVFAYCNATVLYLPGTCGWTSTFGGRPTAPWHLPYPVILTTPCSFGVPKRQFGFRISWATNASVVIEVSADLGQSAWLPLSTNYLVDGWTFFGDGSWTNYPARFYRARWP